MMLLVSSIYVCYDQPDYQFLNISDGIYGFGHLYNDTTYKSSKLVLVDPNCWMDYNLTKKLLEYVNSGGILVTDINFAIWCDKRALEEYGLKCKEIAKSGYIEVKYKNITFEYNTSYRIILLEFNGKKDVVFSNDLPLIERIFLGKGELRYITINPVYMWLESRDDRIREFFKDCTEIEKPKKVDEVIVAGGIVTAIAVLNLSSLNSNGNDRIERLGALATFLFREKELKGGKRGKILKVLSEMDCISFRDLMKMLGIPKTTLKWHLTVLSRYNLVKILNVYNRTYVYDPKKEERALKCILLSNERVKKFVEKNIDVEVNLDDMAIKTKVSKKSLQKLCEELSKYGYVMIYGDHVVFTRKCVE